MTDDYKRLRELAEAATPGPWARWKIPTKLRDLRAKIIAAHGDSNE